MNTLTKLGAVEGEARSILKAYASVFDTDGRNGLKALRDMVEHFDDYASGVRQDPARGKGDLDPWRTITRDRYERGQFLLERSKSYEAAIELRSNAKRVSDEFIQWYKSFEQP